MPVLTNDTETTSISSDSTTDAIDPISIDPNAVTSPTILTSLLTSPTPGTTSEQGCDCKDLVDTNDEGNCKGSINDHFGKVICYVEQPTSCSDARDSVEYAGEKYSALACTNGDDDDDDDYDDDDDDDDDEDSDGDGLPDDEATSISSDSTTDPIVVTSTITLTSLPEAPTPGTTTEQGCDCKDL